jgi:hypothetical protein
MDTFTFWSVIVTIGLGLGAVIGYNFALKDFARWMDEYEQSKREEES